MVNATFSRLPRDSRFGKGPSGRRGLLNASRYRLLDANNHGFRANKVLDAATAETRVRESAAAVCARVVEATRCLDEHVEAHEQAQDTLAAIVRSVEILEGLARSAPR